MNLFYDDRDASSHAARGSQILDWLKDLSAKPVSTAKPTDQGFLYAGARPIEDYRKLVSLHPGLLDRPEERAPLLQLNSVLDALQAHKIEVPTPRTWRVPLDAPLPEDLTFPLFLRTAASSLKLGGKISRVKTRRQFNQEAGELRRLLGWDALILAREWYELAPAGSSVYGPVPQETRVWIVDREPFAWSFHYLNIVRAPDGFPPGQGDLNIIRELARRVGAAFGSRCTVADFARTKKGDWIFIEAGPGSCAGTAHEQVFKAVAGRLAGRAISIVDDATGGLFSILAPSATLTPPPPSSPA